MSLSKDNLSLEKRRIKKSDGPCPQKTNITVGESANTAKCYERTQSPFQGKSFKRLYWAVTCTILDK